MVKCPSLWARSALRCSQPRQGPRWSMTSICQTREHDAGDACAPGCDQHSDSCLCAGSGIQITNIVMELEEKSVLCRWLLCSLVVQSCCLVRLCAVSLDLLCDVVLRVVQCTGCVVQASCRVCLDFDHIVIFRRCRPQMCITCWQWAV